MTVEKLDRAEKLHEKLKHIKSLLRDFQNASNITIKSSNSSLVILDKDRAELEEWLKEKEKAVEKEFAEL